MTSQVEDSSTVEEVAPDAPQAGTPDGAESEAPETQPKGKKRPARVSYCSGMQYLEPEYWDALTQEDIDALGGSAQDVLDLIIRRFEDGDKAGVSVDLSSAHVIIHDKDTHEVWDDESGRMVTETKPRHAHFVLGFDKPVPFNLIPLVLGLEAQFVEKPKPGRYGRENVMSYLIHAKDVEKYQYDPSEVASFGAESYMGYYMRHKEVWLEGRAVKTTQKRRKKKDLVIQQILDGTLTLEEMLLDDELTHLYALHRTQFDTAVEVRTQRLIARAKEQFETGVYRKSVIYITGASGVGKSQYARRLIQELQDMARRAGQEWRWYNAPTRNPMDAYAGEEIVLLDDVRAQSFSWSAWLRLLDPLHASAMPARYRNKDYVAPRFIIITSAVEPHEFFTDRKETNSMGDDIWQGYRRFGTIVRLHRGAEVDTAGNAVLCEDGSVVGEVVTLRKGGLVRTMWDGVRLEVYQEVDPDVLSEKGLTRYIIAQSREYGAKDIQEAHEVQLGLNDYHVEDAWSDDDSPTGASRLSDMAGRWNSGVSLARHLAQQSVLERLVSPTSDGLAA